MNKQRRLGRPFPKRYDLETKTVYDKGRKFDERTPANLLRNRSCYFSPDMKDAGQMTDYEINDEHQERFLDDNDSKCLSKETIHFIKELKKTLCVASHKETSLQYAVTENLQAPFIKNPSVSTLNAKDSVNEIYKLMNYVEVTNKPTEKKSKEQFSSPKNVYISDEPRIKVIAEKFARYKKDNVEVRKLEERVVCIEYDVNDCGAECDSEPAQRLRAYFSIKPVVENKILIPSKIKQDYDVTDEELKNVSDKGIEIIDAMIPENKCYLEDLRKVLKRKQVVDMKKDKTILDPMNLYQLAKRNSIFLNDGYSYTNFLSKDELEEIKDLIMKKTTSSVHGINRRKLNGEKDKDMFGKEYIWDHKTTIEEIFRDM